MAVANLCRVPLDHIQVHAVAALLVLLPACNIEAPVKDTKIYKDFHLNLGPCAFPCHVPSTCIPVYHIPIHSLYRAAEGMFEGLHQFSASSKDIRI